MPQDIQSGKMTTGSKVAGTFIFAGPDSEEDFDSSEEGLPGELSRKARSAKSPPLFMQPRHSLRGACDKRNSVAEGRAMQVLSD